MTKKKLTAKERIKLCIQQLLALEHDWDGEKGKPINQAWALRMEALLEDMANRCPDFDIEFIAPISNGSIQAEWYGVLRALEIEVLPSGFSVVGISKVPSGPKTYLESEIPDDKIDQALAYYKWFAGESEKWPNIS